ncbi:hypothetical protein NQZ68_024458 [Dissostichus eleginoides]|nr:hypothetical protein NQZ68_024458 [Dissostichus eleginoides]
MTTQKLRTKGKPHKQQCSEHRIRKVKFSFPPSSSSSSSSSHTPMMGKPALQGEIILPGIIPS